jgi:hypothetical protein
MSDSLRIALVAEGPTDRIVIEAALNAILTDRSFLLTQIQPEGSAVFGPLGGGWPGVYKWCKQSAERGNGKLSEDGILFNYDLVILHLDADVAGFQYSTGNVTPVEGDLPLPCEKPCPPASDTTDVLRSVLLSWCGETEVPRKTVICMPSKASEAWLVKALFPNDVSVKRGIECYPEIESRLAQQPKAKRIRKSVSDYRDKADELTGAWSRIATLDEARRFQDELIRVVSGGPA